MRYLPADIYKNKRGGDKLGISFSHDTVLIECEEGSISENDLVHYLDLPIIRKVEHPSVNGYHYAAPIRQLDSKAWVMFGGCFVFSSDSRFGGKPLPLHDRVE